MTADYKHSSRFRIMVVEDDCEMLTLLNDELSEEGYEVILAKDGAEAALKVAQGPVDLVITDMKMPNMGGLELLPVVKEACPDVPVIIITAFGDWPTLIEAYEKGIFSYMSKPFKIVDLKNTVRKALQKKRG